MVALQTQGVHWRGREVYSSDMVELKTFGERVAWLLKRRRLADQPIASQKELAVRIGMKPQQLNAYMQGRRNPNVRLAEHDAAIARHQTGLRRADTAYVSGTMDDDRYREQVQRLQAAIEAENSAKTVLQAQADAATQRGSRAEMLAEVAAAGPAMLTLEDAAAANAWLRRYVRVFVRANEVVEVRFDFW